MENLTKENIKWVHAENYSQTRSAIHAYYPTEQKTFEGKWTGEKAHGNNSLCGNGGLREDPDEPLPWLDIGDPEEPMETVIEKGCKKCLKIYNNLPCKTEQ